jgi:fibronectin type 3 domain-containing protein
VQLTWNAPSAASGAISGYNVYRTTSGSTNYTLLNSSVDASTSYTDSSVESGASYDYIVKSVNSAGDESAPSNATTVTIP